MRHPLAHILLVATTTLGPQRAAVSAGPATAGRVVLAGPSDVLREVSPEVRLVRALGA